MKKFLDRVKDTALGKHMKGVVKYQTASFAVKLSDWRNLY